MRNSENVVSLAARRPKTLEQVLLERMQESRDARWADRFAEIPTWKLAAIAVGVGASIGILIAVLS